MHSLNSTNQLAIVYLYKSASEYWYLVRTKNLMAPCIAQKKENSQIGITTAVASLEPSNNSLKPLHAATSLLKALNNLNLVTTSLYQRQIVNCLKKWVK